MLLTGCSTLELNKTTVDACNQSAIVVVNFKVKEGNKSIGSERKVCGVVYNGIPCSNKKDPIDQKIYKNMCIQYEDNR
jgi:hypothetical protein